MESLLHFGGICNLAYILKRANSRKFFCICDKITIGPRTPQCVLGIVAHALSIVLVFLPFPGLAFYPTSFWLYTLFYTGLYTYKRVRELCLGCVVSFGFGLVLTVVSLCQLPYVPWVVILVYGLVLVVGLCLTSYSLKAHKP